jgi:hypothetical protein
VPWSARFDEPIPVPKGSLVTLKDAADYITRLPKTEQHHPAWQAAVEALILVAENNGPTMFARIGIMQALNRHVERVFDPTRKEHHWGRRKLKRDQ